MSKEIKIQIENPEEIERVILLAGATFRRQVNTVDTFFNQPVGKVFKISRDERGDFLFELRAKDGGFEFLRHEPVVSGDAEIKKYAEQFGIKSTLRKTQKFFDWKDYELNITFTEDRGTFFILEGEDPTKELITEVTGLTELRVVRVPFNEMPVIHSKR